MIARILLGVGLCVAVACSSHPSCVSLATVADQCPADWSGVRAAMDAFCAKEAPFFSAFQSSGVCRGRLRYSRYLFDAGPRYCLYDPVTFKLVAYGAFDGKALSQQYSCGVAQEDFDDRDCAGVSCALPDAGTGE